MIELGKGFIDIIFDGPPGPESGRFVEVENTKGESINIGEWVERENAPYWALRIPDHRYDTHQAFVPWSNTDCTEGRGVAVPVGVYASYSDAEKAGHKGGVQGTNCTISEVELVRKNCGWNSSWYGPIRLIPASKESEKLDAAREKRLALEKKAISLGLSSEEIRELQR